jgi:hypothetical protein
MHRRGLPSLLAGSLLALTVLMAAAEDPPEPPKSGRPATPNNSVKSAAKTGDAPDDSTDEEALKPAGLSPDDGKRLVEYIKQRTLSDADQSKIAEIINRFGSDDFEDRVKAAEEIELYGPAAVAPLKAAASSRDPEVSYRARAALKRMAKIPHASVAAAAVRAIVKLKPEGAAQALIGFLPLADDESLVELIRDVLPSLAVRNGKAEPALIAAMSDPSVVRRSAAYQALTVGGPSGERIRIKDAFPLLKAAVRKDPDADARFVALWNLLLTTREKEFIADLIELTPKLARGRIWQLEDILLQMAGTHPANGRFGNTPEALTRARDAWLSWWNEKQSKVDLAKIELKPRIQGVIDVLEMDVSGLGNSRVVSLGPDLKEKWRIVGLNGNPSGLLILPNDRLLLAELNQITERSFSGNVLNRRNVIQPLVIQKGADDGFLVFSRSQVHEYDKNWASVQFYRRNANDVLSGTRLPGGDVLVVTTTNQAQGPNCFRLDGKLKEIKSYTLGQMHLHQWMDAIDDDHILVCELDRVAEYDLKTGKQTWSYPCHQPTSCQRLLNGNTLVALLNASDQQIREVDPAGEVVWDYKAKDNNRIGRARQR